YCYARNVGRKGETESNFLFLIGHGRKLVCRAAFLLFPGSKQQLEGELGAAAGRRVREQKFSAPSMPVQIVSRMRHASGRNHMSNKNIGGGWGSDKSKYCNARNVGRKGETESNFHFLIAHGRKLVCRAAFLLFPGSKQQLAGELGAAAGRRVREQVGLFGSLHGLEAQMQLG
ncbi:hypothetical protein E2320_014453, partial [Naja naja]